MRSECFSSCLCILVTFFKLYFGLLCRGYMRSSARFILYACHILTAYSIGSMRDSGKTAKLQLPGHHSHITENILRCC